MESPPLVFQGICGGRWRERQVGQESRDLAGKRMCFTWEPLQGFGRKQAAHFWPPPLIPMITLEGSQYSHDYSRRKWRFSITEKRRGTCGNSPKPFTPEIPGHPPCQSLLCAPPYLWREKSRGEGSFQRNEVFLCKRDWEFCRGTI